MMWLRTPGWASPFYGQWRKQHIRCENNSRWHVGYVVSEHSLLCDDMCYSIYIYYNWLQTWLLFSIIYINIWDNPYHWLIFFRGVEPPTYAMICRYMCSYMSYPVVTSSLSDTRCIFFSSSGPIFRCRHVFPGGLSTMFSTSFPAVQLLNISLWVFHSLLTIHKWPAQ